MCQYASLLAAPNIMWLIYAVSKPVQVQAYLFKYQNKILVIEKS